MKKFKMISNEKKNRISKMAKILRAILPYTYSHNDEISCQEWQEIKRMEKEIDKLSGFMANESPFSYLQSLHASTWGSNKNNKQKVESGVFYFLGIKEGFFMPKKSYYNSYNL